MRAPAGSVVEVLDLGPLGHGPLDGIDVAVKELFDVGGSRRRSGGRVDLGGPSDVDATAVQLLRRAGARVVARSTSHEFAWGITTRADDGTGTDNPRLPGRVSGGSSGGSAALVAAGTVRLALGTDTAGSVRVPAAFCGVPGWKASNGLVPLDGCVPLAPSLDCGGLLADSLGLLQLGAVAFGVAVPATWPTSWRVGVLDPDPWVLADPERRVHQDELVARFDAEPVRSLPAPAEVFATFAAVQASEARVVHRDVLGTWPRAAAGYGTGVRARLEAADRLDDAVVAAACRDRAALVDAMAAVWDRVDVLLAVLPCGPSRVGSPDTVEVGGVHRPMREVLLPFTCIANLVGAPAVVVPVAVDAGGAPVVVQLMAAPGRDGDLLAWAADRLPA